MLKVILLLTFITSFLFSKEFTLATYNIENLFDLKKDKSDYKEYIPNTKANWNKKTFNIKLKNSIKVIKDIDADILALQEIENINILKLLQKKLPNYKYISFSKYKNSSVGLGFLSTFPIKNEKSIKVKFSNKIYRPILKTTFKIQNYKLIVFNNHWPSKRVSESYRIKYAKKLYEEVKKLPKDEDYILLGDFNSNYDEFKTIYKQKRLNDSYGITGINQVLNTTIDKKYVSYDDILKQKPRVHYNLWLELIYKDRFSNIYRGRKNTPDNILLSPALFDNKKITYLPRSFEVFKPNYLYKNKKILRWAMKNRVHQGFGYSDHLPIFAKFTTKDEDKNPLLYLKKEKLSQISELYKKEKLTKNVLIKDAIVIYKNENNAIIKQKNDRAIYLYKNAKDLKLGSSYDLKIKQIDNYFGLKEVKDFEVLSLNKKIENYKKYFLDASKIDFMNLLYQNEILINLKGFYKKGYLYFDKSMEKNRIKIYFKNKNIKIKNNSYISLKKAHIGYYKNQIQLVIYNQSEIDVN